MKLNTSIWLLVLSVITCAYADYRQEILSDQPVCWWRFNEYLYGDTMSADDETGNISSTYQGDAMPVEAGIGGNACWFNGNLAGIDLGNQLGPLIDGSSAVTFEAWIKNSIVPEGSTQRIFSTRITGVTAGIDINLSALGDIGQIKANGRSVYPGDTYTGATASLATVNQWAHIVCIYNYASDNIKIYIDGSLAATQAMNFASDVYVYGSPTQRDQIGRSPDESLAYRGWLDEVAIYDKALSEDRIIQHYISGNPAEQADLWTSVVSDEGDAAGPFLSSPSVYRFDTGATVASYSYFGPNNPASGTTMVKISYDNGKTWWVRGSCPGVVGSNLFEHDGELYLLGTGGSYITIAKSSNYGATWTSPQDGTTGMLFSAGGSSDMAFEGISMPVLFADGRIYRVFHRKDKSARWPISFATVMISADLGDDLLDAASWTITNAVPFDPAWASSWGTSNPGWLEGNAVQQPDGSIIVLTRVHSDPLADIGAILPLSGDNTALSFAPETGFIYMPGGRNKFNIRRDPVTGKYLSLVNNNTDPSRPAQRNTLSLAASDDTVNWQIVRTIIQDNSPMSWDDSMLNTGFQYVDWQFDGGDIIFISRTAYDGAANYHDSNKITFHRIENYIDFVAPCGSWGHLQADFNMDCEVNIEDFEQLARQWLTCTLPYAQGCVTGQY
jgi:hypothetical protein